MVEAAVISNGLDGIIVAQTRISEVDGQRGRLIICGRDAEVLSVNSSFEETCDLLWKKEGEQQAGLAALQEQFGKARLAAFEHLKAHPGIIQQENPMDALRTAISSLPGQSQTEKNNASTSAHADFARITAAVGVFAANWARRQKGLPLAQPDPKLSIAADFLRVIRDQTPRQEEVQALDTYLTTVSDHGMNASTFTARVVASTESDNISCVVAAIGALKGPLHGGAPGPVLEMLDEIGSAENAEAWLNRELDSGKRIMGMGHRIYRVRDPRAAIFEKSIGTLEKAGLVTTRLSLARAVEKTAESILASRHPERPLKANVEFYTAVLLDALQIPHDLFSAVFATGRVAGWCAHIAEQRTAARLIRPGSQYIGAYPANTN